MGGTIGVSSEPGRGSLFWFVAEFGTHTDGRDIESEPPAVVHGKRVLVVDDNATNRRLLVRLLERWGAKVAEAQDGEIALRQLAVNAAEPAPYDLAIIDFQMPGMNGLDLAEAIRNGSATATLPLILLSSSLSREDRIRSERLGIAAAFQKPFRQSSLRLALQKVWGCTLPRRDAQAPTAIGSLTSTIPSARVLVVEDNATNQMLARKVLEKLGHTCTVAANGQLALDLTARESFDLILMDCQMPVLDGYQTTMRLRDREGRSGRHIPIVAMTANANAEDRDRCIAAGMDDYVAKPVRVQDLARVVNRWLAADRPPDAVESDALR